MTRAWTLLAVVAAAVHGVACASQTPSVRRPPAPPAPSCPVPEAAQVEIEASDHVNVDETGRPLPTHVRLYQVTDLGRLQGATFEELWKSAPKVLGNSLVKSAEVTVYPGQVVVQRFKRARAANYLAAVAIFSEPEGNSWQTVQPWPLAGDPCQQSGRAGRSLEKLRVRMFLDGSQIQSLTNYAALPRRACAQAPCPAASTDSTALRRNRRLRSFEEDPREPEIPLSDR